MTIQEYSQQPIASKNKAFVIEKQLSSGTDSDAYLLKSSDSAEKLIAKVAKNDLVISKYHNEAKVYQELSSLRFLPRLIENKSNILVLSPIEGISLDSIEEEANTDFYKVALKDAAAAIKSVHSVNPDNSSLNVLSVEDFLNAKLQGFTIKFPELHQFQSYYQENKSILLYRSNSRILHGDFCLDHIFIENQKFTGIIDFGDTCLGDPLVDVAYLVFKIINKEYSETVRDAFTNAYFGGEPKLEEQITIKLYLIYWSVLRLSEHLTPEVSEKFKKKAQIVNGLL